MFLQNSIILADVHNPRTLPCYASVDSLLGSGQNLFPSTCNFLGSVATANSTMDFSSKPVDDGVVDSPPSRVPPSPKSCSPSPLRPREPTTSQRTALPTERGTQRMLYNDNQIPLSTLVEEFPIPKFPSVNAVRLGSHGVLLPHPCVPTYGNRMTKSHEGLSRIHCVPMKKDAWDQKSLQLQRRQAMREYKKIDNGYSRGPEILKALEMLKSKSYM